MTERFDEGVKEVLMTLFSLGASMYEADYVLKQLEQRPEPIQQLVQAVKIADEKINDVKFDQVAQDVITGLTKSSRPVLVKGKLNTPQYLFDRLTSGGLTPIAAIGVIANIKAESEFNPRAAQEGPGRGLAQWEVAGRFDTDRINLVKFAKSKGKDWHDLDTQIDFILHELNHHPEYKEVKQSLNRAKNVKDATLIFLTKYEKAGKPHTEKRFKFAKDLAKDLI